MSHKKQVRAMFTKEAKRWHSDFLRIRKMRFFDEALSAKQVRDEALANARAYRE